LSTDRKIGIQEAVKTLTSTTCDGGNKMV